MVSSFTQIRPFPLRTSFDFIKQYTWQNFNIPTSTMGLSYILTCYCIDLIDRCTWFLRIDARINRFYTLITANAAHSNQILYHNRFYLIINYTILLPWSYSKRILPLILFLTAILFFSKSKWRNCEVCQEYYSLSPTISVWDFYTQLIF